MLVDESRTAASLVTRAVLSELHSSRSSGSLTMSHKHGDLVEQPLKGVVGDSAGTDGYIWPDHLSAPIPVVDSFHCPEMRIPLAGKSSSRAGVVAWPNMTLV